MGCSSDGARMHCRSIQIKSHTNSFVCICTFHGGQQGQVRFAFTSALNPDNVEIAQHHAKHGDGVRDVAIRVKDCHALYDKLVRYVVQFTRLHT